MTFTLDELFGKAPDAESRRNLVGHFGKLVIGEERANEEAELAAALEQDPRYTFGPLVVGPGDPPVVELAGDAIATATIADVEAALNRTPEAADALIESELARAEPRKGALRLLIDHEKEKRGGARPEVLKRLEAALG